MDRFKILFSVALIGGAIYWAKSFKISVTGAEAVLTQEHEYDEHEFEDAGDAEDELSGDESFQRTPDTSAQKTVALDHQEAMVRLLKSRQLCEFVSYVKENGIPKQDQYKALGRSLGDNFRELHVFADASLKEIDSYETTMARTYLVGKALNLFDGDEAFRLSQDMDKGLTSEHKKNLDLIDGLQKREPSNLLYAMFRNSVYLRYKNLKDDKKKPLFDSVMSTNQYSNPVYNLMRELYYQSKDNVAQFYLAYEILQKNSSIDHRLIEYTVWRLYDESMREHVNDVLQAYVDKIDTSSKLFGYEGSVYKGYRHVLPFEVYETTLELSQFEESFSQPTYLLSDLNLEMGDRCERAKVNDLAIKLRAL